MCRADRGLHNARCAARCKCNRRSSMQLSGNHKVTPRKAKAVVSIAAALLGAAVLRQPDLAHARGGGGHGGGFHGGGFHGGGFHGGGFHAGGFHGGGFHAGDFHRGFYGGGFGVLGWPYYSYGGDYDYP